MVDKNRDCSLLGRKIDYLLAIENLTKDIRLFSMLHGTSILPVKALLNHPDLMKFKPTSEEIIKHAKTQSQKYVITNCEEISIILRYFVDPTIIIISNIHDSTLRNFRSFLTMVVGHSYFEVHPYSPNSFKVRFADVPTSLSVIMALRYMKFNKRLLKCVAFSSTAPFPEKTLLQPFPKRKTISKKKRGKIVNNHNAPVVVKETSIPAQIQRKYHDNSNHFPKSPAP